MASDIIHISQPGKVEGSKVRLGEMVSVPVDPERPEGPKKLELKLGRICVKLGNGLELSEEATQVPGCVGLAVTAAAAERFGWPHPANQKISEGDVPRLLRIVGNPNYGQQEQLQAIRDIATVDVGLARQLQLQHAWLMEAV